MPDSVVFTNKARCRDCYRCLRVCPVKAIKLEHDQAQVVQDLCIACGTCVRECPQHAKQYRHDVASVVRLLASGQGVAASVAPSFAADLQPWEIARLPTALRRLGFSFVGETAVGAWHVARQSSVLVAEAGAPRLCTACPAFVRYVQAYRPELAGMLLPVASPMVMHARLIKAAHPDWAVVFIGPCVAKKLEATGSDGDVDHALTFAELKDWLTETGIDLKALEESDFEDRAPGLSGAFPLPGGLIETSGRDGRPVAADSLAVAGFPEIEEALGELAGGSDPLLLEALFCPHGCINGPGLANDLPLFARRRAVLAHMSTRAASTAAPVLEPALTYERFEPEPAPMVEVSEEAIRRVLNETGKGRPEDQLNCGACGYSDCRAKAIAVLRGMAEREMCLPLMRRLAERRTDRIIETSPNGIVIVDQHLNITHMNPAFRRYFVCSDALVGRRIATLMDPEPFERLAAGQGEVFESTVRHPNYHLVCHQIIYALRDEQQYVGIFVNITHTQANRRRLDQLRSQTLAQAQELLEHQVGIAQQMAQFLGQSTAQGQALVRNLVKLAGQADDASDDE
jgi:PAS domain S-box-containing protein